MKKAKSARRESGAGPWSDNNVTFTVVGDVNIDLVFQIPHLPPADGDVESKKYVMEFGGTALNTAFHLKRLGMEVSLLACVGKDQWGDLVLAHTKKEALDVRFFQTEENTGVCVVMETPFNRHLVTYRGANAALERYLPDLLSHVTTGGWVHFSSTTPSLVTAALDILHKRKCVVSYDPGGIQVKKIDSEASDVLKDLDYLFLNNEEFRWFEKQRSVISPQRLVVKSGANGAKYFDAKMTLFTQPEHHVKGPSKGAGDAFDAVFIACMALCCDPTVCLKCAVTYATSYLLGGVKGEADFLRSCRGVD